MKQNQNTYLSVALYVSHISDYRSGSIYFYSESAKLNLHVDAPYQQAKAELARLMLRSGKMPRVRSNESGSLYVLEAFLD